MEVSGQLHDRTALLLEKNPVPIEYGALACPRAGLDVLEKRKTSCLYWLIFIYATRLETNTEEARCTGTSIWNKHVSQENCCNSAHTTNLGIHLFQIQFYSYNASFDVFTGE